MSDRPAEGSMLKSAPPSAQSPVPGKRYEKPYPPRSDVICHYCRKPGHIKSSCLSLKRKNEEGKIVGLISAHTQISSGGVTSHNRPSCQVAKGFEGFVSKGAVSGAPYGEMVPISILRDTGASQSLMVQGVIDLPPVPYLKAFTPVKGVGGGFVSVPLHKAFLTSNIVNGPIVVGVVPYLPIEGVSFVLGNDLAGTQVCVTPVVSEEPCEVFTACVVTRSQARTATQGSSSKQDEVSGGLADTFLARLAEVSPCSQFSREALISEQENDPSVAPLRQTAASADELWTVITQIVLPERFRKEVLSLAHEVSMAGHLGIRKTQEKVRRHFYWLKMHKDVVSYCRSCHACQIAGKPNLTIPVAPLCPLPVMEEPFSRVLIDCVGPLPKTKKGNEFFLLLWMFQPDFLRPCH